MSGVAYLTAEVHPAEHPDGRNPDENEKEDRHLPRVVKKVFERHDSSFRAPAINDFYLEKTEGDQQGPEAMKRYGNPLREAKG